MSFTAILGLGQTALELALFNSLTVLALFLSYTMLNVCDLSTDGCYALGAAVGAVVAIAGHTWLSIPAAMCAGMLSGLVAAVLWFRRRYKLNEAKMAEINALLQSGKGERA